ncbi:efflux RND transporter permease subunit [Salmonella enterica]|nr:efflux RND transporter permease subunit [Salmonella enterica]EKJ6041370.1 efflux RND transporter permease subunit [Salmonella enterica]
MANFFIRRPIFAWVLAIILMMAGALAIMQLPVAQYPTIAPPAVSISATYPGADAQTVQDTVTQVIEQNMNGIDNLMYMSSTSDSAGSVTITLTFQSGTDPDIAQVQVQNKLQLATPLLPQEVQQQGISVEKSSSSFLMVAGFVSDNPNTTQDDISDYVASNIKDSISRLNGVGDVQLFGAQYAMRIWLDANLLNKYQLTPVDVINQLKVQNDQIAAGQLGGTPALPGQQLNASIIAQTRLKDPQEFGKVTLRVNTDGSVVHLKDVARIELGGENYNGMPSMELLGEAAPGRSTGEAMSLMENLASQLPNGIGYDWTGMSYQERLSGNQAPALYAISLIVVFLCLAALYESWSIPFSVMLVVPLGVVGALLAASLRGLNNDVYFQVGLLTTIGLSAKNAILIVEFAKDLMEKEGRGLIEATLEASRMRLRPILMTSLAFILGVMPLVISRGAGSGAQNAVGTGVMGGMLTATLLAIFFVPVFFVVVKRRFNRHHD